MEHKICINFFGQQLIDAFSNIATKPYINEDSQRFQLAQLLPDDTCLLLKADRDLFIDPSQTYHSFTVISLGDSDLKPPITPLLEEFVSQLKEALLSHGANTDNWHIVFTHGEKTYYCAPQAFDTNQIELPDGRIVIVLEWSETMPPVPVDYVVLDRYMPICAFLVQ